MKNENIMQNVRRTQLTNEYVIAKNLASNHQHAEALELFLKILKERYEDAWAYYCARSLAVVKPGAADEEELSLLGPKRSEYDYQSGKIFYAQNRYEEALPFFRQACKARPDLKVWKERYIKCLLNIDIYQKIKELADIMKIDATEGKTEILITVNGKSINARINKVTDIKDLTPRCFKLVAKNSVL